MKTTIVLVLAILCCLRSAKPTGAIPQSHQSKAEAVVATLLANNGHAAVPGFVQTLVNRLGDGAAVGVIEYLGDRRLTVSDDSTSPDEVRRILEIVRMAFAGQVSFEAEESRTPKATLVLLKYLSCLPAASAVKNDLDGASIFIEEVKKNSTLGK